MLEANQVQPVAGLTLGLPARTKHWTSTKAALLTVLPPPGSVTLAETPPPTFCRVGGPNRLIWLAVGLAVGVVAKVAVGLPVGRGVKVGEAVGVRVAVALAVGFAVALTVAVGGSVAVGGGVAVAVTVGVAVGTGAEASASTIPELRSSATEQVMLCAISVPCVPCPRSATA